MRALRSAVWAGAQCAATCLTSAAQRRRRPPHPAMQASTASAAATKAEQLLPTGQPWPPSARPRGGRGARCRATRCMRRPGRRAEASRGPQQRAQVSLEGVPTARPSGLEAPPFTPSPEAVPGQKRSELRLAGGSRNRRQSWCRLGWAATVRARASLCLRAPIVLDTVWTTVSSTSDAITSLCVRQTAQRAGQCSSARNTITQRVRPQ